jgi:AAA+ ATPase superfamily predicted ATPase
MSLRILSTPLTILEFIQKKFPTADANIREVRQNGAKLEVILSKEIPPLLLDHAVDAFVFSEALQDFNHRLQLFLFSNKTLPTPALDISRFSLEAPIDDWQQFQRIKYEKNGRNCRTVLMNFLQGDLTTEPTLVELGLAPRQITGPLRESDYFFFKEIPAMVATLTNKRIFLDRFKTHYPTVYERTIHEIALVEKQQYLQNQQNFYQNTMVLLQQNVIGQDRALEQMANLLAIQRNSNQNEVYLFVGPTGVGKTELAKAVAKTKEGRFISFPMNQYPSEHDYARFFGVTPGYVGSTDRPHFAKELDKFVDFDGSKHVVKNVVILFDEMEKVHSSLKQAFLTMFDEKKYSFQVTGGLLSSNTNNTYYFENCIFINTSNLYQQEIMTIYHRGLDTGKIPEMFKELNLVAPLPTSFSPEFLGRMSHIISFGPIPRGVSYQKLLDIKLTPFMQSLKTEIFCKELNFENKEQFIIELENLIYGEGIDIRRVHRFLGEVKGAIYQNEHRLGGLKNKKFLFSHSPEGLIVKVFQYVESMCDYDPRYEFISLKFT